MVTQPILIRIIVFSLIAVIIYFCISFKENYSSIFTIDINYNPDFNKDTIIIPPFQEDYFKSASGDYNEYQYNNRQVTVKKYPWLKNTYLGQSQKPQDSNTPQSFTSF
jgi:hypothetical protein